MSSTEVCFVRNLLYNLPVQTQVVKIISQKWNELTIRKSVEEFGDVLSKLTMKEANGIKYPTYHLLVRLC